MESYIEILKNKGFKITPRRNAIIKIFLDGNSHLTPKEVWQKLSERFARCGLPSVYRNLESLAECGILTRIQQFDRRKHYGLCTAEQGHHHHHITCVKCGRVEDIKECAMPNRKKIKGFKIVSHFVQVNGVCKECFSG